MRIAEQLDDVVQDDDFAVATYERYLLLVWRKRVTIAGASAARHAMTQLHARLPASPLAFITLVEAGCSLHVPGGVRDIVSTMLKEHNQALAAAAVAYERAGFMSAIARSVITAINLASAAAFRSEVCHTLAGAVAFTTHVLGDGPRARGLVDAIDGLRSQPRPSARSERPPACSSRP